MKLNNNAVDMLSSNRDTSDSSSAWGESSSDGNFASDTNDASWCDDGSQSSDTDLSSYEEGNILENIAAYNPSPTARRSGTSTIPILLDNSHVSDEEANGQEQVQEEHFKKNSSLAA